LFGWAIRLLSGDRACVNASRQYRSGFFDCFPLRPFCFSFASFASKNAVVSLRGGWNPPRVADLWTFADHSGDDRRT
jgi:hypothetical protein